jgi:hypothetical protein
LLISILFSDACHIFYEGSFSKEGENGLICKKENMELPLEPTFNTYFEVVNLVLYVL